jgi:mannose/fructose-specific phosphotransferase system component IIA
MSDAPRAVVAGHGKFAEGIISAVQQITGMGHLLTPVSNTGLAPTAIDAAIREALEASQATVVFTDLPAGSCTATVRRISKFSPGITLVTGVTLPTLLAFVMGASIEESVAKGREALGAVEPPRGA